MSLRGRQSQRHLALQQLRGRKARLEEQLAEIGYDSDEDDSEALRAERARLHEAHSDVFRRIEALIPRINESEIEQGLFSVHRGDATDRPTQFPVRRYFRPTGRIPLSRAPVSRLSRLDEEGRVGLSDLAHARSRQDMIQQEVGRQLFRDAPADLGNVRFNHIDVRDPEAILHRAMKKVFNKGAKPNFETLKRFLRMQGHQQPEARALELMHDRNVSFPLVRNMYDWFMHKVVPKIRTAVNEHADPESPVRQSLHGLVNNYPSFADFGSIFSEVYDQALDHLPEGRDLRSRRYRLAQARRARDRVPQSHRHFFDWQDNVNNEVELAPGDVASFNSATNMSGNLFGDPQDPRIYETTLMRAIPHHDPVQLINVANNIVSDQTRQQLSTMGVSRNETNRRRHRELVGQIHNYIVEDLLGGEQLPEHQDALTEASVLPS